MGLPPRAPSPLLHSARALLLRQSQVHILTSALDLSKEQGFWMAADSSPLRSPIQSHAVPSLTPAPMLLAQAQSLGESRLPGESCRERRLQQDGGALHPRLEG